MLVIIKLNYRNRLRLYYFGRFPIKKPFIAVVGQFESTGRVFHHIHAKP
jgi:hypothetical protein